MTDLEILIKNHIHFNHPPNADGWLPILCKVCNDHGHKGMRGGFLFTSDAVMYHCFNCAHKAGYSSNQTEPLSKKMLTVLKAFSVPDEEIQQLNFQILQRADSLGFNANKKQERALRTEVQEVHLPKTCIPLKDVDDTNVWKQIAELYLKEIRGIDPTSYPFLLSLKEFDTTNKTNEKWDKRLIIPCYKNDKLIYYEGRDLTQKAKKKYVGAEVPKSNMMYGFDKLHIDHKKPLFVVEGFFDAFVIDGVAVFGNVIYKEVLYYLNSSPRTKIVIPDRYGDGYKLAEQALNQGWKISTPKIGNCKDINEAVLKYGKLYVIKSIMENIHEGFNAQLNLQFYCIDYGK